MYNTYIYLCIFGMYRVRASIYAKVLCTYMHPSRYLYIDPPYLAYWHIHSYMFGSNFD